jgi:hypothetical protein
MSARVVESIRARIEALWNAPHAPRISASGAKARLTHPLGKWTEFDLSRKDLANIDEKLLPALAELRK